MLVQVEAIMQLSIHFFLLSSEGFDQMEFHEDRYMQAQRPKYDCLLFGKTFRYGNFMSKTEFTLESCVLNTCSNLFADLDDTLYPLSTGVATACRINIEGN